MGVAHSASNKDKFKTLIIEGKIVKETYTVEVDGELVTAKEILVALRSYATKRANVHRAQVRNREKIRAQQEN